MGRKEGKGRQEAGSRSLGGRTHAHWRDCITTLRSQHLSFLFCVLFCSPLLVVAGSIVDGIDGV